MPIGKVLPCIIGMGGVLSTSCVPKDHRCQIVKNEDIPFIKNGGALEIIQISRMPHNYTYLGRCTINNRRMTDCRSHRIARIDSEELESVSKALEGLEVNSHHDVDCVFAKIYIAN